MFYSHEFLTDRKHGVATIWLFATLGSRSSLKKITRKAIMDVNVPNACETITDPSAPMALRLQGNLLFGVSRVFSQQCAYVLTDMQSLRDRMRGVAMLLKELETDPDVTTTRPEQLNISADPGFNIDLDMGFDLSSFDVSFLSQPSSLLSPRTLASSQTSIYDDDLLLSEPVPLGDSPSHRAGDDFQIDIGGPQVVISDQRAFNGYTGGLGLGREEAVVTNSDIGINDDELVLLPHEQGNQSVQMGDDASVPLGADVSFNLDISNAVPQTRSPTNARTSQPHTDDEPVQTAQDEAPIMQLGSEAQAQQSIEGSTSVQPQESEATTGVAQQRTAKTKLVPIDDPTEMPNRALADWNDNYLELMDEAHVEHANKISLAQAKRNAAFWVLDQGIGAVDTEFRADGYEHPLSIFSGQALLDALMAPGAARESRKRSASAIEEEAEVGLSRRVRSRSDEQATPDRNGQQQLNDDDRGIRMDDYDDIEPQVGREAQAPLSEHTEMPWNAYAVSSRQGSARPAPSATGVNSSAGGPGTFDIGPLSATRRMSRLIPESPLEQRRLGSYTRAGSLVPQDDTGMGVGGDFDMEDSELDRQLAGDVDEEFELYGPAAEVSTQEAANSQWLAATLEQEAFNFLSFLETTIQRKDKESQAGADGRVRPTTTFEELLPPGKNTNVVAAQGLLHVLSLATKGLIRVMQTEDFGDIVLGVMGSHTSQGPQVVVEA